MIISASISVTAIEHSPAGLILSTLPAANVSSAQTIDVIGHFDISALSAFAIIVVVAVSGGANALLSRPGTNYTERSCMKRSTDDFGRFNETAPGFLTGGTGFGILGEDRPEIMPADRPPLSSGGTIRFPTATEGHNSRFPSFGSFGGDTIDRLPNKNHPPIRIPPSNKSWIYFRYCNVIVLCLTLEFFFRKFQQANVVLVDRIIKK